jgi:hypothetical protein
VSDRVDDARLREYGAPVRLASSFAPVLILSMVTACSATGPLQKRDAWESNQLPPGAPLTEEQKIERLIAAVRKSGMVLIRDGSEHPAEEAADSLQEDWDAAGDVATARDFIEKVAARSPLTGRPHVVRAKSGDSTSRDWLTEQLAEIEANDAAKR